MELRDEDDARGSERRELSRPLWQRRDDIVSTTPCMAVRLRSLRVIESVVCTFHTEAHGDSNTFAAALLG